MIQLRPHQARIVETMSTNPKGQVIVPTGGGKTQNYKTLALTLTSLNDLDDDTFEKLVQDAVGDSYTALEVSQKIGRSKVWIHRWGKTINVGRKREADGVYVYTESEVTKLRTVETRTPKTKIKPIIQRIH